MKAFLQKEISSAWRRLVSWWRLARTEIGAATIEWIALAAVVVILLAGIFFVFRSGGGERIYQAGDRGVESQIQRWR